MSRRSELLERAAVMLPRLTELMEPRPQEEDERGTLRAELKVIDQKWKSVMKELSEPDVERTPRTELFEPRGA
jgi:hypothetical protein